MKGTSYTYFTTDNSKSARELIGILREAKAHVPPQLEEMAMYSGGGGRSLYCLIGSILYTEILVQAVMVVTVDEVAAGAGAGVRATGVGDMITMVAAMEETAGECTLTVGMPFLLIA